MPKIFELVTGTIRIERRNEFHRLHKTKLLRVLKKYEVKPIFLSVTYVGDELGKFYDIYEYPSLTEYQNISDSIANELESIKYYEMIQSCIIGTIKIQLLRAMDYSPIQ